MAATQVTITGYYEASPGVAATGTVEFQISHPLGNTTTPVFQTLVPIIVTLSAGSIPALTKLYATDDAETSPQGAVWKITERITGAKPRTWEFALSNASATQRLVDLYGSNTSRPPPSVSYTLLATHTDHVAASKVAAHALSNISNAPAAQKVISATSTTGALAVVDLDAHVAALTGRGTPFICIGDSNALGKSTLHPNASIYNHSEASLFTQASMQSRGRLRMIRNSGVAADTTTMMVARFTADVLAYSPKVVGIMGGTNDIGLAGGSAANYGGTWNKQTTMTNIQAMVTATIKAHAIPFVCLVPPRAAYTLDVVELNQAILDYCRRNNVICPDTHSPIVNAATGALASGGYAADGVHLTESDAYDCGAVIVAALDGLLAPQGPYLSAKNDDAKNLLPDANFTDALVGYRPPAWSPGPGSFNNTTVTTPAAGPGDDIVGNWLQFTRSASSGADYIYYSITSGFSVGDVISLAYRFQILTAGSGGGTLQCYLVFNGSASRSYTTWDWTGLNDGLAYMEQAVPAGTTSLDFYLAFPAGTITARIAQPTVMNLTTLNWSQYG